MTPRIQQVLTERKVLGAEAMCLVSPGRKNGVWHDLRHDPALPWSEDPSGVSIPCSRTLHRNASANARYQNVEVAAGKKCR